MSDLIADGKTTDAPHDGLAILQLRRSTAETFGIPLAVLAELTHRCPLQCPYCSNPVELDRGGTELTTDEWKKVLTELAEIGVLEIIFPAASRPRARISSNWCSMRPMSGLQQSDYVGGVADQGKTLCAGRCRLMPCADQFSGQ